MIPELREGVLKVEGAATKEDEDGVDVEEKAESESTTDTGYQSEDNKENSKEIEVKDKELLTKKYQVSVLNQIQFIFGHLAQSQLQFHVPQGFWKTFKWVRYSFARYSYFNYAESWIAIDQFLLTKFPKISLAMPNVYSFLVRIFTFLNYKYEK